MLYFVTKTMSPISNSKETAGTSDNHIIEASAMAQGGGVLPPSAVVEPTVVDTPPQQGMQ